MHVIQLDRAFGYSVQGNSPVYVPSALGSSNVKIAMIDTGQDTTHPELSSKIVYQRCFITNYAGGSTPGPQSMSNYTTDEDGHGTNTAGIAAGDINNDLGFASAGGNVEIYGYRVFPTPNDDCTDPNSDDVQCGSSTADIGAAITDAKNQNVNVISMSLGDDTCVTPSNDYPGGDPDPTEGGPVEDAIAANIIVVAAAGNSGTPRVNAPGCDTGVIAVGATSLADGQPNGSNKSGGSSSSPFEYVASYTDSGSPGADVGSSSAWGIVAPGGDPTGDTDADNLHWIQNIWTSTPFGYKQSPPDTNFYPYSNADYPNYTNFPSTSGSYDPQTLIAGTSMATPHVAGAAALILSATNGVSSPYQNPTAMKQLLCSTADDISDANQGCGRLNVYRAMAAAVGDTSPPGPSPVP